MVHAGVEISSRSAKKSSSVPVVPAAAPAGVPDAGAGAGAAAAAAFCFLRSPFSFFLSLYFSMASRLGVFTVASGMPEEREFSWRAFSMPRQRSRFR